MQQCRDESLDDAWISEQQTGRQSDVVSRGAELEKTWAANPEVVNGMWRQFVLSLGLMVNVDYDIDIFTGWILSPMTWFDLVQDNCCCQLLSGDDASLSLVTSPVKTTPELFRPAFRVLPKTGDTEPEDRGKPGWERSRTICAQSGDGQAVCLG